MAFEITIDLSTLVFIILGVIGGSATVMTIVWNASRRSTSIEKDTKNLGIMQTQDKMEIQTKINDLEKDLLKQLADTKVERREEISKAVSEVNDKITVLQKQIDATKVDLKDSSNRVTITDTKVKNHDDELANLHHRIDKNIDFFTNWNQRAEDRIEKAQDRSVAMVRDSIREFMGHLNMIVNSGRRTR